jgi:Bromodomain
MLQLKPMASFLSKVLDQLISKDQGEIFAEPVDINEVGYLLIFRDQLLRNLFQVPDYVTVVTQPMDFSTMKQKLEDCEYADVDDLEADFNLMLSNCMAYNSKETVSYSPTFWVCFYLQLFLKVFYRAAVKMRDLGGAIIRQARRDVSYIGFDSKSGLLLTEKPYGKNRGGSSDEQSAIEGENPNDL